MQQSHVNYYNQLKPSKTQDYIMKSYKQLKTRENEWCEISIELKMRNSFICLSITGCSGEVMSEKQAKKAALDSMISFFDENKQEIYELNERCDKAFRRSTSAAKYVLSVDGAYHGLDVHQIKDGKVYITYSCGQIVRDLKRFFPEHAHLLEHHLNDMHAGTPRQDAALASLPTPYTYDAACAHLESLGLLEDYDPQSTKRYKYGQAWLKRALPIEIIEYIMNL